MATAGCTCLSADVQDDHDDQLRHFQQLYFAMTLHHLQLQHSVMPISVSKQGNTSHLALQDSHQLDCDVLEGAAPLLFAWIKIQQRAQVLESMYFACTYSGPNDVNLVINLPELLGLLRQRTFPILDNCRGLANCTALVNAWRIVKYHEQTVESMYFACTYSGRNDVHLVINLPELLDLLQRWTFNILDIFKGVWFPVTGRLYGGSSTAIPPSYMHMEEDDIEYMDIDLVGTLS